MYELNLNEEDDEDNSEDDSEEKSVAWRPTKMIYIK